MKKVLDQFMAHTSLSNALKVMRYAQKHPMAIVALTWDELEYFNQAKCAVGKMEL